MSVAGLSQDSASTTAETEPVNNKLEQDMKQLYSDLQRAFLSRKRANSNNHFEVWDPTRGAAVNFHVSLVDKDAHFIPRKAKPADSPEATATTVHSPISPLSPNSPLHPDGIMNPVFIKKHRDMLPSVFVLVLRLFESSETTSPLSDDSTKAQQKSADQSLVSEILKRKKETSERGIKLAVVLLVSRHTYDHKPDDIDDRLILLRRASGLDSRASLFVITTELPMSQIHTFVASLKSDLFDSALDYYREHGRRSRRKKGRVGTINISSTRPLSSSTNTPAVAAPLGPQGWTVRYDYKLAIFAEFRQELPIALKHYEDAYAALLDLFAAQSSAVNATTSLRPGSKRFSEAKVLADTICFKVIPFNITSSHLS